MAWISRPSPSLVIDQIIKIEGEDHHGRSVIPITVTDLVSVSRSFENNAKI
jgi:hypothetical protein